MIAINIDGQINIYASIDKVKGFEDTQGREIHNLKALPEADIYDLGFREYVRPQFDPATQKLANDSEAYFDSANDWFTVPVLQRTPEELAAEAAQKQQIEKEKIKDAKINYIVETALTPAEAMKYYKEWEPRPYAKDEGAVFKLKPFRNTIEGNINAPDKGGWIEIK